MSRLFFRFFSLLAVALIVVAAAPVAHSTQATAFSGRAVVLSGQVAGIQLPCVAGPTTGCQGVVDTGPLAAQGGALSATAVCYPPGSDCVVNAGPLPPLPDGTSLSSQTLHAAAVAPTNNGGSHAEAAVETFGVTAAGQSVSAGFLMAQANAKCNDGKASVSGSAEIVSLAISGLPPITVTGAANQQVPLPNGGLVILNEQIVSVNDANGSITVNALHIKLPAVAGVVGATDLTVAQAHADIVCANPSPPPPSCSQQDFITGGGYIATLTSSRGNFAVAGGKTAGWGHLTYIDHGTGMKVKGTGVTGYYVTGPTSRKIVGNAEVNGQSGYTYQADVADNGEPGRGADTFHLQLFGPTPYDSGSTTLSGGNIQLHCK
jgi:hypothetical protein